MVFPGCAGVAEVADSASALAEVEVDSEVEVADSVAAWASALAEVESTLSIFDSRRFGRPVFRSDRANSDREVKAAGMITAKLKRFVT